MSILYSLVARETILLAKYGPKAGNFEQVVDQILPKIQTDGNHKFIYSHGAFLFHYICENKLIYMCITDKKYEKLRAFSFLDEIKKKFIVTYGLQVATAIKNAMEPAFSQVLANEMNRFELIDGADQISKVTGQISEVRNIMEQNIESLIKRGDGIQDVIEKTNSLQTSAHCFRQKTKSVSRKMYWKNKKMCFLMVAICIVVTYAAICLGCGGLLWQTCISHK